MLFSGPNISNVLLNILVVSDRRRDVFFIDVATSNDPMPL